MTELIGLWDAIEKIQSGEVEVETVNEENFSYDELKELIDSIEIEHE